MNYYIEKHDMEIILDALGTLHLDMIEAQELGMSRSYTADEVWALFESLDNSGEETWDLK